MYPRRIVPLLALVVLLLAALPAATAARPDAPDALDKIEPLVLQEIETAGRTDFFLWLTEKADLSPAEKLPTKQEKGRFVYETLVATAERTQKDLRAALDRQGARYEAFYIANKILVYGGDGALLLQLAARPDVARVTANHQFKMEEPFVEPAASRQPETVEPNISFVNADDVWALGYTGQGTVLADNGVGIDETHPALRAHYRGCVDPPACTTWDHNYNWWDAVGNAADPYDDRWLGTFETGIMVGDDGGANQIGMAPGARTIHCKSISRQYGWSASFIECYQWDLAPWDLSGQNPRPDLAPDAVNNSWGYGGGYHPEFEAEIAALQAAGILVEATVHDVGPACATITSPGDYEQVLTVGSVSYGVPHPGWLSWFSGRGPSFGYPDAYFPNVMAPGQNIRSSIPSGEYQGGWSSAVFAAPHVAGLVGLLWSACPQMRGQVALTRQIIQYTAVPLTGQGGSNCGGDYTTGPNNDWGYGTIDALAAVQEALVRCGALAHLDGHVYDLATAQPIAAAQVTAARDAGGRWTLETDADGYYSFTTPAGAFTVTAAAFGYYPETVAGVGVISGAVTTQDFSLAALPAYLVSGTVVEAGSGAPLSATVAVVGSPYPPAQTDPGTGFYALSVPSGTHTLRVKSWGYYRQEREIAADHDQAQDFSLVPLPFVPDRRNPLLEPGPPGAWDGGMVFSADVTPHDGLIYLYYTAYPHPYAIGYATSTNGVSFTKALANPVLTGDGTGFDAYEAGISVLLVENGTWILYYGGAPYFDYEGDGVQVGRATAPGPAGPWTRSATPVLATGSAGEWDQGSIVPDSIVRTADGYALYYYGCLPDGGPCKVGMATSKDGVQWTKYDNPTTPYPPYAESDPVLFPGPGWDNDNIFGPWVRQTAAGREMFYSGVSGWSGQWVFGIGYATSADGVHWFKYAGNPVLDVQYDPWAVSRPAFPSGFISGTTTLLYYDDLLGMGAIGRASGGACMPLAEAIFSWQPVTPTLGEAITLTAAAAGTDPVAFAWDLGDGITATGRVVGHTYAAPGAYTVTLTATNCQTGTATAVHVVTVQPPCVPVEGADFSWEPLTPAAGAVVTFSGTVAAGAEPIAYAWDFGDSSGAAGPAAVVTHTYGSPGVYTVVMTASNCLTATATAAHTITVTCPDVTGADLAWTPDPPVAQQVVTFTAAAGGPRPLTYAWDLGDSTFALGPVITHTYAAPGPYTVRLTATNDCGAWQAVTDIVTVAPPCQEVSIVSVTTDIAGCAVTFGAELAGTPPFDYLWDFGPVGTSTATNPLVHFPSGGVYSGTLSVWNCGNAEPAVFAFTVEVACARWYWVYLPLVVRSP